MKFATPLRISLCVLVLVAGLFSAGIAQTTPTDTVPPISTGLAHENVTNVGARSPGNMVTAGVSRSQAAIDLTRTQSIDITETATEDEDFGELILAGAKEVLLEQFQNLVLYFFNLFLERAGLPPLDPDIINGNDNDNDNSNANDNDNDNGNDNDNDNDNGNDNDNDNDNDNGNDNQNDNANSNANVNDNTRPGGGLRKSRR